MNIYIENGYCVYLTVYRGNKLPPFYIGSSSVENVNFGYHGSVSSKRYKEIWKHEVKFNNDLFTTKIIAYFNTRREALCMENKLQHCVQVVNNPLYINQSYAQKNGAIGRCGKGVLNSRYGAKLSESTRLKISNANKGKASRQGAVLTEYTKTKISNSLKGRTLPKEQIEKTILSRKANYVKKYRFTNGEHDILSDVCPDGYISGWSTPSKSTRKGLRACTNGTENKFLPNCPKGWWYGFTGKTNSNKPKKLGEWLFVKDDIQIFCNDLYLFCRENNLNTSKIQMTLSGKRHHHKGWKCIQLPPCVNWETPSFISIGNNNGST